MPTCWRSLTRLTFLLTPRIQERSKPIEPRANSRRFYKDNFPVDLQFRIRQNPFSFLLHYTCSICQKSICSSGSRQVVGEKYDQSEPRIVWREHLQETRKTVEVKPRWDPPLFQIKAMHIFMLAADMPTFSPRKGAPLQVFSPRVMWLKKCRAATRGEIRAENDLQIDKFHHFFWAWKKLWQRVFWP